MWEAENRNKAHLAGLDAEGNRLTSYAAATLSAKLFGGTMYIDIDAIEKSMAEKVGTITQAGIYDHCGHLCRTMKLNNHIEIRMKRFGNEQVEWKSLNITLESDIYPINDSTTP